MNMVDMVDVDWMMDMVDVDLTAMVDLLLAVMMDILMCFLLLQFTSSSAHVNNLFNGEACGIVDLIYLLGKKTLLMLCTMTLINIL